MIGKCVALRNHQPFLVLLHWSCFGTFVYFLIAVGASTRIPGRMTQRRMRLVAGFIGAFCGTLCVLLREEMKRIRQNCLRGDEGIAWRFDRGEKENVVEFLGEGWTRRWWPRVSQMTGFEWAMSKRPLI
jgi:hypothetical protein